MKKKNLRKIIKRLETRNRLLYMDNIYMKDIILKIQRVLPKFKRYGS